ncbi:MAG: hypothetical protein OEL88_13995 [Sterolibacteriaceae bacterium MAG5]|nr:hypothetical protein [Candidatus Nitricoxidireducens bremensis]
MSGDITPDKILDAITDYLSAALAENIITLHVSGNPQSDSLLNQKPIADTLRAFAMAHPLFKEYGIVVEVPTSSRSWCDFIIRSLDGRLWLPINLKVSSCDGRDDLSSKDGLFFALTGLDPEVMAIRSWEAYCKALASNIRHNDCAADYYYLVVRKNRTGDGNVEVFWTSLLNLCHVHPNGNRPPFQCRWAENRERAIRTRSEAIAYLLGTLEVTLIRRANALTSFSNHLSPLLRKWEAGVTIRRHRTGGADVASLDDSTKPKVPKRRPVKRNPAEIEVRTRKGDGTIHDRRRHPSQSSRRIG